MVVGPRGRRPQAGHRGGDDGEAVGEQPNHQEDGRPESPTLRTHLKLSDGALADAILEKTRSVSIRLEATRTRASELHALRELLDASPGACPVEVVLVLADGSEAVLALEDIRVTPNDAMLAGLERVFGDTVAELR